MEILLLIFLEQTFTTDLKEDLEALLLTLISLQMIYLNYPSLIHKMNQKINTIDLYSQNEIQVFSSQIKKYFI